MITNQTPSKIMCTYTSPVYTKLQICFRSRSAGYEHFCVWDQDIINAMREDLWGHRGVRILPCRWSIFPLMNWQFFWPLANY